MEPQTVDAIASKHLWEIDHDYYCAQDNYYSNDCSGEYQSWADFLEEFGDADMDYNLVFRWDWHDSNNQDHELEQDELQIFILQQRKGRFTSAFISVDKSDEPQVIEWLKPRYAHLMKLWQPFGKATPDDQ